MPTTLSDEQTAALLYVFHRGNHVFGAEFDVDHQGWYLAHRAALIPTYLESREGDMLYLTQAGLDIIGHPSGR